MRFILLFFICFSCAFGATEYFGTDTTGTNYDCSNGGYVFGNGTVTLTCPGTGQKAVKSLGAWVKSNGGSGGYFRCAIYNAARDSLFAQHSVKIEVLTAWSDGAWRGETTPIQQYYPLVGGDNYTIVICFQNADPCCRNVAATGSQSISANSVTYYNQFPATITLGGTYSKLMQVRAGVDDYTGADTTVTTVSGWQSFESGSHGDALTLAILNAGQSGGPNGAWAYNPDELQASFVDTFAYRALRGPVQIWNTIYWDTAAANIRGYRLNHGTRKESALFNFYTAYDSVSIGFWWQTNLATDNSNSYTFSNIGQADDRVNFAIVNDDGGDYVAQIEVSDSTVNGPALDSATWYWITTQYAKTASMARLAIYSATYDSVWQVECPMTSPASANRVILGWTGGSAVTEDANTYFDNLIIDYTDAKFPLLPEVTSSGGGADTTGGALRYNPVRSFFQWFGNAFSF